MPTKGDDTLVSLRRELQASQVEEAQQVAAARRTSSRGASAHLLLEPGIIVLLLAPTREFQRQQVSTVWLRIKAIEQFGANCKSSVCVSVRVRVWGRGRKIGMVLRCVGVVKVSDSEWEVCLLCDELNVGWDSSSCCSRVKEGFV